MDSFHVIDVGPQASAPLQFPALGKQRPLWRYIGVFSVASFIIGTLCGYLHLKPAQPVTEEDDLSTELNLGIDTLLKWFPEKNAKLKGKKQEIVFHMMNFTDESDSAVSKLVIDTSETDEANKAIVIDRRLQTADNCKEAVLDFILAFTGWLKRVAGFSLTSEYLLRESIALWLLTNIAHPAEFKKFMSNIIDFARSTKPRAKLKALWAVIKEDWKRVGGWIKEVFKLAIDRFHQGAWPQTKALIKLASQMAMWIKIGPSGFIGQTTLQFLVAETMINSANRVGAACRNLTVFKKLDEAEESGSSRNMTVFKKHDEGDESGKAAAAKAEASKIAERIAADRKKTAEAAAVKEAAAEKEAVAADKKRAATEAAVKKAAVDKEAEAERIAADKERVAKEAAVKKAAAEKEATAKAEELKEVEKNLPSESWLQRQRLLEWRRKGWRKLRGSRNKWPARKLPKKKKKLQQKRLLLRRLARRQKNKKQSNG